MLPAPFKRLFISYSRADEPRVTAIVSHLRALGAPLAIDAIDARPNSALADRLQGGGYLAVMLSSTSARSAWVLDDLRRALAEERDSGRVKVIPCLLDACEVPGELDEKPRCDFSQGVHRGLSGLVAAALRDAELLTCSIDRPHPLRIDSAALRTQLEAALQLSGPQAVLYFALDSDALERELLPLWAEHAERNRGSVRASQAAVAELLLRNLATCLGKAAQAARPGLADGTIGAALLGQTISHACALVLAEHWKLLRQGLGDTAIQGLRTVDGRAALAELDRLEASSGLAAQLFGCAPDELAHADLCARPPLLSGTALVPRSALSADTLTVWKHGHCPPALEVLPDEWWRCAVPGLARHFALHWARLSQTASAHADEFSMAVSDYESIGPR